MPSYHARSAPDHTACQGPLHLSCLTIAEVAPPSAGAATAQADAAGTGMLHEARCHRR